MVGGAAAILSPLCAVLYYKVRSGRRRHVSANPLIGQTSKLG